MKIGRQTYIVFLEPNYVDTGLSADKDTLNNNNKVGLPVSELCFTLHKNRNKALYNICPRKSCKMYCCIDTAFVFGFFLVFFCMVWF